MDSEDAIHGDFESHRITKVQAAHRLQGIGYHRHDAEAAVDEWADALSHKEQDGNE